MVNGNGWFVMHKSFSLENFFGIDHKADFFWSALAGWFMKQYANSSGVEIATREKLAGHKAREVMVGECLQVEPAMTILELVREIASDCSWQFSPVISDHCITGLVTYNELNAVPIEKWSNITVGMVMIRIADVMPVTPNTDLCDVFRRMAELNKSYLPVNENGKFVGMVLREYIVRLIQKRAASAA
jgi:predicted transcriptional regulator